jgi:HK97 family phage portal protein
MGLIDRVEQRQAVVQVRRATRADPVTLEELGALLERNQGRLTRTGISITDKRALGITAWYSGVRYLAEKVAFLPVHTFRDAGSLAKPRRERRADPLWLLQPDKDLPWQAWVEFGMYALLHRGNYCSLKLRDDVGRVTGLRPIHPNNVRLGTARDGTKMFAARTDDGGEVGLTTREILHVPGLSVDGKFGLNPIQYHGEALGTVAASDEAAQRYYENASHPAGVISHPDALDEDEADRLKGEWEKFHRGLKNFERIGVLTGGAKYESVALKADDAQLLQSRQYGVLEVARLLRIPPHKLYELSRATFSNIEHQAIEAVVDSVQPWVERFETWVNFDRDLATSRTFIEFQLEGLLRGDTISRYRAYQIATGGHPWMTPAEPRRLENLPEIDGLDFVPKPLNMGAGGTPPQGGEDADERMEQLDERVDRLERSVAYIER